MSRRRLQLSSTALIGAVLLGGCSLVTEQGAESTTTAPVTTSTSTTSSSSSTTSSSTAPSTQDDLPLARDLVGLAQGQLSGMKTITITGYVGQDKGQPVKVRSHGSAGGGFSEAVITYPGGGKVTSRVMGFDSYLRFDKTFVRRMTPPKSPLRGLADRWLQLPTDRNNFTVYTPHQLVQQHFFGEFMPKEDILASRISSGEHDGTDVFVVTMDQTDGSRGGAFGQRIMWVTKTPGAPRVLRYQMGQMPRQTRLDLTRWNKTNAKISKPAGAKVLTDEEYEDLE